MSPGQRATFVLAGKPHVKFGVCKVEDSVEDHALSAQVARLKQELGELHGTDTVALRCVKLMGMFYNVRLRCSVSYDCAV